MSYFVYLLHPAVDRTERTPVCDIIDEQDTMSSAKIRRSNGTEPLLPRCVPDLERRLRKEEIKRTGRIGRQPYL